MNHKESSIDVLLQSIAYLSTLIQKDNNSTKEYLDELNYEIRSLQHTVNNMQETARKTDVLNIKLNSVVDTVQVKSQLERLENENLELKLKLAKLEYKFQKISRDSDRRKRMCSRYNKSDSDSDATVLKYEPEY